MPVGMQDKDDVKVKGVNATSGNDEEINSVDDNGKERLCVDAKFADNGDSSNVMSVNNTLGYYDMAVISRGTTINVGSDITVYSYSGSGVVMGVNMKLTGADADWILKLEVDGVDIWKGINTTDLRNIYGMNLSNQKYTVQGINMDVGSTLLYWTVPCNIPIRFTSSLTVKVNRIATSKPWDGGVIVHTKDT